MVCVVMQRSTCGGVCVQNPIQAIVQHSEHNVLYAQDPLMQGFHARHISHMLDIFCENQGQTGFTVAEVGAGTGGFTRQVKSSPVKLTFCPPSMPAINLAFS